MDIHIDTASGIELDSLSLVNAEGEFLGSFERFSPADENDEPIEYRFHPADCSWLSCAELAAIERLAFAINSNVTGSKG